MCSGIGLILRHNGSRVITIRLGNHCCVRGLRNLLDVYVPIVSTVWVFDGSTFPPTRVVEVVSGREQVFDDKNRKLIMKQGKEVQSD